MSCSYCKNENVVAKGLCQACYYRQKRTGSLEHKSRKKQPLHCTFEGCRDLTLARGLCETHYRTVLKHGDVISPFGYGERKKHPLYEAWRYQTRVKAGRVGDWNDFWQFVSDVGERPELCVCRRLNERAPWGPDNFRWGHREAGAADKNEYMRKWTARNPMRSKGYSLKKAYGISLDEYAAMYASQNGRCGICDKPGKSFDRENGRTQTLAVDHHHDSRKVRGLLCTRCNRALGGFKDSIQLLGKAAAYMKRHQ